jgi:hypothetical protein
MVTRTRQFIFILAVIAVIAVAAYLVYLDAAVDLILQRSLEAPNVITP